MSALELVAFSSSIASLILAIVAIWLVLHHKKESDSVNEATKILLMEVRSDAKIVSTIAMPELKAYGESMRNFVFEVKKPEDDTNTYNALNQIKNELEELKSNNGVANSIASKIDKVEKILQEKQDIYMRELEIDSEELSIDLTSIGYGVISSPISQFQTVQDLLDMLWYSVLNKEVGAYTYSDRWVLKDGVTNDVVYSPGKHDHRDLTEAGIMGGMQYTVELC